MRERKYVAKHLANKMISHMGLGGSKSYDFEYESPKENEDE